MVRTASQDQQNRGENMKVLIGTTNQGKIQGAKEAL